MKYLLDLAFKNSQCNGSGNSRIKIVLANDNPAVMRQLRRSLNDEFKIVGTVTNGRELLEAYDRMHPEVVVTDISMPVMDGIEAVAKLNHKGTLRIVFLTVHEEPAFVEEARSLGAMAYVLKRSRPAVLIDAIRSAHAGRFFLCPELRE